MEGVIHDMKVLFYMDTRDGIGERLQRKVETVAPAENLQICRTVECLIQMFRRPLNKPSIAVVLTTSKSELSDILSIRDFLLDVPIILILPDRNKETIAKGFTLYPRFMSYVDGDFNDVAAVLGKMLNRIQR